MPHVKQGHATEPRTAAATDDGLAWDGPDGSVRVVADGQPPQVDPGAGRLAWRLVLERGVPQVVRLRATTTVPALFGSGRPAPWATAVEAGDVRLERVVQQGLADLAGLLLDDDGDAFLAAGSPWFLTLFGRDSLWAARMLLPLDTGLALSTLRVLARRQGRVDDPATEEQPGKILHEVRGQVLDLGEQRLPPLYYGSVDATPLFVCVLADALEWGADRDEVRALVPAARACLEWVLAQARESGWLTYVDHTGEGLSNQGWKDSHDSIQFADGRLAEAPISLSEVQAYAHEAAVRGAALLAELGAEPVPGLDAWAADLRSRFARDFWVDSEDGGHVAVALDRDGERVDSVASNMGHLLGTGLLAPDATARVAALLADPALDSGFGLRTLTSRSPRFSPLSYHGGTVWPHDTAIAVRGLAAEGRYDEAGALAAGIVRASEFVDHRLPELYGGDAAADVAQPTAYPAACRPQAWAAAAPVACLVALSGLRTDRRRARSATRPGPPGPWAAGRCAACGSGPTRSTCRSTPTAGWGSPCRRAARSWSSSGPTTPEAARAPQPAVRSPSSCSAGQAGEARLEERQRLGGLRHDPADVERCEVGGERTLAPLPHHDRASCLPTAYGMTSSRAEWVTSTGTVGLMVPIRCASTIDLNGSCWISVDIGLPLALSVDDFTNAWLSRSNTHSCSTWSLTARPRALRYGPRSTS